jgi:thiamine transport system substrate-binding protein
VHELLKKAALVTVAAITAAAALTGCTSEPKTVTIATHDSFVISAQQIKEFKKQTGLTIKVVHLGDAGALTNKLVLTQATPVADAFFGIDNTFSNAALEGNVVVDDSSGLTPIDFGDVCFNYDRYYFEAHQLTAPADFTELVKPEYQNLTVIENPASSSTGLAFLATTVAQFGTGYQTYWRQFKTNGVKIDASWEDAYYVDFSGSSGKGAYPIVLSYSTSPADEVRDDGQSQTASMNSKCFRQTEYAGVLANAKNPGNAKKLVEYLRSSSFQKSIAESMYMYPSALYPKGVPASWAKFGTSATTTIGDKLNFATGRQSWIETFIKVFG